jgi:hypothetical protein
LSNGKHAWIQGLPVRWLPLAGFWPSGFHKLDSLDSTKESSKPRSRFPKPLIMSRFSQILTAGGFRLDSPVKVPVASEMLRSAPSYTNRAREDPCQGGLGCSDRPRPAVQPSPVMLRCGPSERPFAATAKTAGGELTDCAYIGAKVGRWLNAAVIDPKGDGACFSTIALQQSMWPTIGPSLDRP